jgi:hypothetical protein
MRMWLTVMLNSRTAIVRLERLRKLGKFRDPTGNRTRDISACSIVQVSTLPRFTPWTCGKERLNQRGANFCSMRSSNSIQFNSIYLCAKLKSPEANNNNNNNNNNNSVALVRERTIPTAACRRS